MQKTSEDVKEELKNAMYELGGIPPPLSVEEKALAQEATAVLLDMGGEAKTKDILQELRAKGLTEKALFLALKSGKVAFRNKIWYVKNAMRERRCVMNDAQLVVEFPLAVKSLQESGDYESGVPASAIKGKLGIEDMQPLKWRQLVSEAIDTHEGLRREGMGAGTRYYYDAAEPPASTEPSETPSRSSDSNPPETTPADFVSLTDERTGTTMQFRRDVDVNVDGEVITHGPPGELGEDLDLLTIRWEDGRATAMFGPYAFGATSGQPDITIPSSD